MLLPLDLLSRVLLDGRYVGSPFPMSSLLSSLLSLDFLIFSLQHICFVNICSQRRPFWTSGTLQILVLMDHD